MTIVNSRISNRSAKLLNKSDISNFRLSAAVVCRISEFICIIELFCVYLHPLNIDVLMKLFNSDLFNIDLPNEKPSPGSLLVAEPFLKESYFNHAVICLIDYEDGEVSMGLVMNKSTSYNLADLVSSVSRDEPIPVYCGGPMSRDRLYFIHTLGNIIPGSKPIRGTGLFIGGDFDCLIDYINSGYPVEGIVRFYLGYSGWDAGQLDDELRQNIWAVTPIADGKEVLTGSDDGYWHGTVKRMGRDYRWWRYHPQHPHFN